MNNSLARILLLLAALMGLLLPGVFLYSMWPTKIDIRSAENIILAIITPSPFTFALAFWVNIVAIVTILYFFRRQVFRITRYFGGENPKHRWQLLFVILTGWLIFGLYFKFNYLSDRIIVLNRQTVIIQSPLLRREFSFSDIVSWNVKIDEPRRNRHSYFSFSVLPGKSASIDRKLGFEKVDLQINLDWGMSATEALAKLKPILETLPADKRS
jgi:hypothetical protein